MNLSNDERKRTHSSRTNGWLATLGGAALLIAIGLGVGLVAGTAYEEPTLVADHLTGKTSEVPLAAVEDGAESGAKGADVSSAPPPSVPPAAAPAPAAPPVPAPAPLGAGSLHTEALAQPAAVVVAVRPPAPAPAKPAPAKAPAHAGAAFSIQVGAF